jgi:PAS domain S-box-containing protein
MGAKVHFISIKKTVIIILYIIVTQTIAIAMKNHFFTKKNCFHKLFFIFGVMKNKSNKIILTYFLIVLILVFTSQYFLLRDYLPQTLFLISFLISFSVISASTVFFGYLISKNFKNVTKHLKKLEVKNEELFKSNERYDIVAKATSDTIWDWDTKTNKFIFNKGIHGIFGYNKDAVGDTIQWWFDKIHPEDSLKMSVKVYSYIEQKTEKWQDYYRFLCGDGSYKYVYDRGFLVMDENDSVIRVIGAMQDITKLKEEEQRLRLLETVITQTKDAIIITEADSNERGIPKIVYVNPAFSKLTGYNPNEVIGKTPQVFMSKNSVKADIKNLNNAIKKKEEFTFETINVNKNNQEYWVNFTMIPITNFDDEHSHWISIQRDISKEKEREEEREHLISELTQNNKDLKQFSYITSHNLRAPLSNLTGLLNLIEDIPIENEELKELIDGFSKSTNLLNETINDLVKVIIIKDSPSIEKEEVIILDVFENVFNQLTFIIGIQKPILKLSLGKTKTLVINKTYLESILLNLMTNSLKYRDEKRQLRISITSYSEDNMTIIKFTDNGIGIDLERNKDKVFGLYQRFHNHTDSKGLGLYLVKSQIEAMGGNIAIKSEVGKGTSFKLSFKNQ